MLALGPSPNSFAIGMVLAVDSKSSEIVSETSKLEGGSSSSTHAIGCNNSRKSSPNENFSIKEMLKRKFLH